jgi:hypothetical protein
LAPLRNHLGLAHGADKEYIEFGLSPTACVSTEAVRYARDISNAGR